MDARQLHSEIHKPLKKIKQFYPVINITEKDNTYASDLLDMSFYGDDDYKYILMIEDCYSRYLWAYPMKSKTAHEMKEKFTDLFNSGHICKFLWVDGGKEYKNQILKRLLDDNNVTMYSTYGDHKSMMVERANLSIKRMIIKHFEINRTFRWVAELPNIISAYNNRVHSRTKVTPHDAYYNGAFIQPKMLPPHTTPKYRVGDNVRISRIKSIFEHKGYSNNYSTEIYTISKIRRTNPVFYELVDWNNEPVIGGFYEEQLTPSNMDKRLFLLETVYTGARDFKTINGVRHQRVKYVGYKEPQFVPVADIVDVV